MSWSAFCWSIPLCFLGVYEKISPVVTQLGMDLGNVFVSSDVVNTLSGTRFPLKSQFPLSHAPTGMFLPDPITGFQTGHLVLQPFALLASTAGGWSPCTTPSHVHPPNNFIRKVSSNHPCSVEPSQSDQCLLCAFGSCCSCLYPGSCLCPSASPPDSEVPTARTESWLSL